MELNKAFLLFTDCKIVKGIQRSMIVDLSRNYYNLIPNSLFDILDKKKGNTINQVLSAYNKDDRDTILEYFDFLINKEYIFFIDTDKVNQFPEISNEYNYPSQISNSIIDINENYFEFYPHVFAQLAFLKCSHIQIRFFYVITRDKFWELVEMTRGYDFLGIEILMPYVEYIDSEFDSKLLQFPISKLVLYNSPNELPDKLKDFEKIHNILFYTQTVFSDKSCGSISPGFFTINQENFNESNSFNSCLNRKISIDYNGEIKNCPSMSKSFGHITKISLTEALLQSAFKELWNITKDKIGKCKDCEFRMICTDCRAYLANPTDLYSAPLKCGYDPKTAKWNNWVTDEHKRDTISFYGLEELKLK